MTLGQLLLLVLIVAVFWLGSKVKKHEEKIDELQDKKKKSLKKETS